MTNIPRHPLQYLILGFLILSPHISRNNENNKTNNFLKKVSEIQIDKQVDSIVSAMTIDERIGQLFMIPAYSSQGFQPAQDVLELIKDYKVGGLIFFKGYPTAQAKLTNYYQSQSKTPLFIAMDAEWGVSMRLDSSITFPKQMTMGSVSDNNLIYDMGRAVARECKRLGVHINFAPVADINSNPMNPVIHLRSFGENKTNVASKAYAYMKGMQDGGIMAVAKHFPGHGDTDVDSHKDLPLIKYGYERLDSLELYPFKYLIEKEVKGIMVAHIQLPAIEKDKSLPATLSPIVINGILKDSLDYKGLIFTDALNMKGATKYHRSGELEAQALIAGNDILLFPTSVPKAVIAIKKSINNGSLSVESINQRAKKIIKSKILLGVFVRNKINTDGIVQDLQSTSATLVKRKLIEASITLLKDKNNLVPLHDTVLNSIVSIAIGPLHTNHFQDFCKNYCSVKSYHVSMNESPDRLNSLIDSVQKFKILLVSLHSLSSYNVRTFGISQSIIQFLKNLSKKENVVLINFGSPYALSRIADFPTLLQVTENGDIYQESAAEALFGGIPIKGKSSVSINAELPAGSGIIRKKAIRLKYSIPESVGIRSQNLAPIDSMILTAIKDGEMPGCQVLIARKNTVIYNKSFGFHTYDEKVKVNNSDLYDLASITKVAATLLAVMKLYDQKKLSLDNTLKDFFTDSSEYPYRKARVKDMLLHEAGFEPWIAFYKQTLDKQNKPSSLYFSKTPTENKTIQVTDDLYVLNSIVDTIWKVIYSTEINKKGEYSYSDLDFIFMKRVVDSIINSPFNEYLDRNFYNPMGMDHSVFNPSNNFPSNEIIPTEDDQYFRNEVVKGYVHDPAAALLGGISGHAGLFSNANDLAKLCQMLLNEGAYGYQHYFNDNTIRYFTANQSKVSRRGLGFDKPERNPDESYSPASRLADTSTFGHTGFTGTCLWVDPKNELIYIFLSNRTFPDSKNKLLLRNNTRNKIHDIIYEAIQKNSTH